MNQSWTEVVQAIVGIATLLTTVIAFALVIRQMKQMERSVRGSTNGDLYAQAQVITLYFLDHPEIRPFFYENKSIDQNDPKFGQVMACAELMADYFEHVSLQKDNLPPSIWPFWENCIRDIFTNSQALRAYVASRKDWYGNELHDLVGGNEIKKDNP